MRFLLLFWAVFTAAAQVPADDHAPLFRTTTRIVEVSVHADWSARTQDRKLLPRDLHLFDNNEPQTIKTLERVAGPADPRETGSGREPNRRAERRSILLFDALNTTWADQAYTRAQAAKALEQIPAGETIAILLLGNGLKLVQDFSSDRGALQALIRRLSGETPKAGGVSDENPFSAAIPTFNPSLPGMSRADAKYALWAQRQRILQTFSALKAIAGIMKGAPGQKSLLWLSAAFPLQIGMPGTMEVEAAGEAAESFHDEAVETTRELTAANVTIYPVDARGLCPSPSAMINIQSMIEIANLTGGKAFYNTNDLAAMIRKAIEDSRDGYILTYSPTDLREDGEYHTIRLRCDLHGVRLRYRLGYWADAAPKNMRTGAPRYKRPQ
jgi:VWFA-related protein